MQHYVFKSHHTHYNFLKADNLIQITALLEIFQITTELTIAKILNLASHLHCKISKTHPKIV